MTRTRIAALISAMALAGGLFLALPAAASETHACMNGTKFVACVPSLGECRGICLFIPGTNAGKNCTFDSSKDGPPNNCNQPTPSALNPCTLGTTSTSPADAQRQFLACVTSLQTCTDLCAGLPPPNNCKLLTTSSTFPQCQAKGPNDPSPQTAGGGDMHACFKFKDNKQEFIACVQTFDACSHLCQTGSCGFTPISVNGVTIGGSAIDTGADSNYKCDCKFISSRCSSWDTANCYLASTNPMMTRSCGEDWTCGQKNVYQETAECTPDAMGCSNWHWECGNWDMTFCTQDAAPGALQTRTCKLMNNYGADMTAQFGGICGGMPETSTLCPALKDCGGDITKEWRCTGWPDCPQAGGQVTRTCELNKECKPPIKNNPELTMTCKNMLGTYTGTGTGWVNPKNVSTDYGTNLPNPLGTEDLPSLLGSIIRMLLDVTGSIALLMFVYGGYMWLTSAGEKDRVQKGKDIMKWATVGVVLTYCAYVVVANVFKFLTNISS